MKSLPQEAGGGTQDACAPPGVLEKPKGLSLCWIFLCLQVLRLGSEAKPRWKEGH